MVSLVKPYALSKNAVAIYGVEGGTNTQCFESCHTNSDCECYTNENCNCGDSGCAIIGGVVVGIVAVICVADVPEEQFDC